MVTALVTTKSTIRAWIEEALAGGYTHMIVAVDTFDHSDYPVTVRPDEDVQEEVDRINDKPLARVIEVYDLRKDIEPQINSFRAWNL